MKHGLISYSSAVLITLLAAPLAAWADANPDFDDDAKPILKMQPGLIRYVESRFDVKDTGTAKYPGDDDRPPSPPFIFRARPLGSHGPYNLRLLIQPGPPGHILGVVDITKVHLTNPGSPSGPSVANRPPDVQPFEPQQEPQQPPQEQPAPAPAPSSVQVPELSAGPVEQQPAPAQQPAQAPQPAPAQQAPANQQPTAPTADTPSGPILDSNGQGSANAGQPSLQPPPDPAPANQ
jgi:hypothetical protein